MSATEGRSERPSRDGCQSGPTLRHAPFGRPVQVMLDDEPPVDGKEGAVLALGDAVVEDE